MPDRVKLAIIGCGGMAGAHLGGYEKLLAAGYDKFQIVAVCDTNAKNAAAFADRIEEFTGTRPQIFGSVKDMLDDTSIDAADICTPHAFHHTTAIPCLRKGIHVMIEKPGGITIKAGKKILAAAEKSGAIVATAEQVRRCKGARVMEWAINRKKVIGTPSFFTMEVLGHQEFNWRSYAFAWRGLKLLGGGGMLYDAGVHFADMMLHVFGPVAEVHADLRTFFTPMLNGPAGLGKQRLDVEDTWLATLHFESGLVGHWSYSREAYGYKVRTGVYYGTKGSLRDRQEWMHPFQHGADLRLKDGSEVPYEKLQEQYMQQLSKAKTQRLFPYGLDDGVSNECWDFIEAIDKGRQPEVDGYAALKAKALCYAFYESNLAGKPIKPADVESGKVNAYQRPIDEYWKI